MAFALRPACRVDGPAVTSLLQASYGQLMPSAYGAELTSALLPIIAQANVDLLTCGTYYLAVTHDNEIIGAGGWTRERPGSGMIEPGTGHIRHVAIHPDWAGKGVGRAIIERGVAEAWGCGINCLQCCSSLNAVDFYRRLGFLEVRPIDVPMGGDLVMPSLLMERILCDKA